MKALVTGAGGMIGSHLCRVLLNHGHQVRGLFLPGEDASVMEAEGVEIFRGDITKASTLKGCVKGCEIVYHCAAKHNDWGARRLFVESIVEGTRNLLEESVGQARRFVHVSSIAAYGMKYSLKGCNEDITLRKVGIPYGDCKADAEVVCRSYAGRKGLEITIIRPSNVLGPASMFVRDILDAFLKGNVSLIDRGRCETAFVFVENLVDGMVAASQSRTAIGRAYHFCDDYSVTWNEYINALGALLGKKTSGSIPFAAAWYAGYAMELACLPFGQRPPLSRLTAAVMGRQNHVDCARAKRELDWTTRVAWNEAMDKTITWVKEVYMPGKGIAGS